MESSILTIMSSIFIYWGTLKLVRLALRSAATPVKTLQQSPHADVEILDYLGARGKS